MTKYLMAALVVAVASTVLALSFPAEAQLQESAVILDPALTPELERNGEARVLISLRNPDLPLEEWTVELRDQNAAERQARVLDALTSEDFTLIRQFEGAAALGGYITESGVEKLARHPDVVDIGVTGLGSYSLDEVVPLIDADDVHAAGYDGSGINVAVLDTGIDTDHPDLSDSIVGEMCFPAYISCGPPAHPAEDTDGHGTLVSGVITSNGTSPGVPKGVAPGAGVFVYAIGPSAPDEMAVLDALRDIENRGYIVDFVNMSFSLGTTLYAGTCITTGVFNQIVTQIAVNLFFGDVLSFAASGNNASKAAIRFPACAPNVVAVGVVYDENMGSFTWPVNCRNPTTQPDKVACASNSSDALDLLAPGCRTTTTFMGGGPFTDCGTSLASPAAAGVAALLKDAQLGLAGPVIGIRMNATGKWVFDPVPLRWTPRVDARVALLTNDNGDWDGDGCRNGSEYTLNVPAGAYRNPLDSEDYYDVSIPKDGVIDLSNDISGVIDHYSPVGAPPYDVYYDRGPSIGPFFYNHGPRDGVIDLANDILSVINQYNPGGC